MPRPSFLSRVLAAALRGVTVTNSGAVSAATTTATTAITQTRGKMPFYAVARGNKPGIYNTWAECQSSICGYSGARYKKFATESEAKEFVQENAISCPVTDRREGAEKKKKEDSTEPKQKATADKRKRDSVSDDDDEEGEGGQSNAKKATPDSKGDDKSKFKVDDDGFLVVYTDGACWMNGKQGAKAGMGVFFGHDHPLNVSEPIKGRATNNNAEIQAATCALELAHSAGFDKVAVYTDSKFMIDCASSWMKNWKKKGWVKSDGEPVKNKEELIDLDKVMQGLAVKWVHVKGHTGNEGNEEADKLARQGAKSYTSDA